MLALHFCFNSRRSQSASEQQRLPGTYACFDDLSGLSSICSKRSALSQQWRFWESAQDPHVHEACRIPQLQAIFARWQLPESASKPPQLSEATKQARNLATPSTGSSQQLLTICITVASRAQAPRRPNSSSQAPPSLTVPQNDTSSAARRRLRWPPDQEAKQRRQDPAVLAQGQGGCDVRSQGQSAGRVQASASAASCTPFASDALL